MLDLLSRADARSRLNFVLLCAFLAAIFLFGGASRADVLSQTACRLAAITLIAASLMQITAAQFRLIRLPLLFLLAAAAIIAVQLVPIPWSLWASLPGRAQYVQVIEAVGAQGGWRPISLTPDLTLNSLLALLPAFAVLLGFAIIDRALQRLLVPILLVALLLTALIGLLQISNPAFYFYQVTNNDSAVGVFANRNHQAVFLATAFPLLAVWAISPHADQGYARLRGWAALCMAAGIFPLLLVTGSRAGLILALVSAFLSALLVLRSRTGERAGSRRMSWGRAAIIGLPLLVGLASIAIIMFFSRAEAIERFFPDGQIESRTQIRPTLVHMAGDFFPVGSGFGSFDPVFRGYEPYEALSLTYFNQAHNDFAQVLIEGGALPVILIALFLVWMVRRSWSVWMKRNGSPDGLLGRAGSIIVLLLLCSSAVDYPLRTPILSVLIVVACVWMLGSDRRAKNAAER